MNKIMSQEQRNAVAFKRLQALMKDMGWDDEMAVEEFYQAVAEPIGLSQKSVSQWFERGTIPTHMIFNIAAHLGISADWLAGLTDDKGERAGVYRRDVRRLEGLGRKRSTPRH